ncbi:uncharacterized protein B0H18DRAFT_978142 [Fomitopsis serialis]|uniref:uncharacterized protein n=1 Tax=Fomitopsis serialis TaxID=139415 RepID=UPI002008DF1C|nr:uncharacterized protein B0H18DRAFT_978142 [Neoantrodia serialis]KAH9934768.1 hypothetical protein B0H18DRAFT_978142 [Neoantrodia serialis]
MHHLSSSMHHSSSNMRHSSSSMRHSITLKMEPNRTVIVMGPSGSGKTAGQKTIVGVIFMLDLSDNSKVDRAATESCKRFIETCGSSNIQNAAIVARVRNAGTQEGMERVNELRNFRPFEKVFNGGASIFPRRGARSPPVYGGEPQTPVPTCGGWWCWK